MKKYYLTCGIFDLKNLENFILSHYRTYLFYGGLPTGEYLFINIQTNEIEFSDVKLLKLLEGNYKEVNVGGQCAIMKRN